MLDGLRVPSINPSNVCTCTTGLRSTGMAWRSSPYPVQGGGGSATDTLLVAPLPGHHMQNQQLRLLKLQKLVAGI
eukprot:3044954-Amphidinium_carterae.2